MSVSGDAMTHALTVHREQHVQQQIHTLCSMTVHQHASWTEPLGPGLNNVFMLNIEDSLWVGRKTLTMAFGGRQHLSSLIRPSMLLGRFTRIVYGSDGITVQFITAGEAEKTQLFQRALNLTGSELYFPFPVLDSHAQEYVMHEEHWRFSETLAQTLNEDERHFRDHCTALLQSRLKPGARLLDPACSTGAFIASMASALPHTRCVGADCSLSMVAQARTRHRLPNLQFHHRAAQEAPQPTAECDVLFLRFLNAEVMSRDHAQHLLMMLLKHLKHGAMAIVFGHTPVLPNIRYWAHAAGLKLISSLAARPDHLELFECYVLQSPVD